MFLCLRGSQMPLIYNADCPGTRLSAYTRTGTVVTSRLFHRECSWLRQHSAEKDQGRRSTESLACLLWLSSTADSSVSQTPTETHATASSYGRRDRVSPVCAALTSSPAVQVAAHPRHPDLEQRGLREAFLLYGCVDGESHEP